MPMPYDKLLVLFPPRPDNNREYGSPGYRELLEDSDWIAEIKVNGQRNTLYAEPVGDTHKLHWWSRDKDPHRNFMAPDWLQEEILKTLKLVKGKWSVIDGELIHAKDASVKNTVYFWDVLVHAGQYLVGTTRKERHDLLFEITGAADAPSVDFIRRVTNSIWVADTIEHKDWDQWPRLTKTSWIEGFVLKNELGRLTFGLSSKNNSGWQVRCRKPDAAGHIRHG